MYKRVVGWFSVIRVLLLQKPTFSTDSRVDELSQLLQSCRDVPQLDLLSSDNSMDLQAAMVQ